MSSADHEPEVDRALSEALQRLPQRRAPARLVRRVEHMLSTPAAARRPRWRALAPALAAAAVLLIAAPAVVYQHLAATRAASATMVNEAIGNHLRVVQAQRPLEVESSDSHRVRPWFEGRLDFSPVLSFAGDDEVPL